jgi:hypothetical protein
MIKALHIGILISGFENLSNPPEGLHCENYSSPPKIDCSSENERLTIHSYIIIDAIQYT